MSLANLLHDEFRGDIRFRGEAYLKADRVRITRVDADEISAVVRASDNGVEYPTRLRRAESGLERHCACSESAGGSAICKHVWATILAVDAGGYVAGPVRNGRLPPFAADRFGRMQARAENLLEPLPRRFPTVSSDTSAGSFEPPVPSLSPWEEKLERLRQELLEQRRPVSRTAGERQIIYQIDLDASRTRRQLVVQVGQRRRRASGSWGRTTILRLRADRLDEVERSDDRTILAYLMGGLPERTTPARGGNAETPSAHRFALPPRLAHLLLPVICATERVHLLGEDVPPGNRPLQWDEDTVWELWTVVRNDPQGDGWRLECELRQGERVLQPHQALLVLPGGFVFHSHQAARLNDYGAFEWLETIGPDGLTIPDAEQQRLVDRLLQMPTLPKLDVPDSFRREEVHCRPSPELRLRVPQNAWLRDRLLGEVWFQYEGTAVAAGDPRWAIAEHQRQRWVVRQFEDERQYLAEIRECGARGLVTRGEDVGEVEIPARRLGDVARALMERGWRIRTEQGDVRRAAEIRFRVRSGIDWFELSGDVDFEGATAALPEILSALSRGDTTVRLADGSLGILPDSWTRQYGLLAGLGQAETDRIRFTGTQAALLDALLSTQPQVDYDPSFAAWREKIRSLDGLRGEPTPDGFHGELRDYQRIGLAWLRLLEELGFGGCLADDMGLGKTIQLLALLQSRKNRQAAQGPTLIVVPRSLLFNWISECKRFTPELRVLDYTGPARRALRSRFADSDVVFTTYGTLRRDILALREMRFDYVVLDEAQTIKNAASQAAKAVRLLNAQHRLALSGTPIENHLSDLWSIFEFLNPGMLGRSSAFNLFVSDPSDEQARDWLARGLAPFILRRTKAQVANELPEKVEQTIACPMDARQRRLYQELKEHYRQSLLGRIRSEGLHETRMHVLEALLRLRQAACHPALLKHGRPEDSSAKLDVLLPHLEELIDEGHKALVFSQFTSMLAIVRRHLDRRGIVYEYLDGKTRRRRDCVQRFQNDADCGVFLISLKAGGLGLNLTAADYVFLLDPWWNPAVETQAIDRAHRVGQTRKVVAYRLICQGTVEERILELQQRKRQLAEQILREDAGLLRSLTIDDLEMLLS